MICQQAVDRMRGLLYSAGYEAIDERSMIAIRYTHKPGELLGKPYVPIKLRTSSGNPEIEIAAILNSGADAPVFSIEIAYRLGLSKGDLQGHMAIDAIGPHTVYGYPVEIEILGKWYPCLAGFTTRKEQLPLLGRVGGFTPFVVMFDEANQRFCLFQNDEQ
jgi:hypothetical protein